ncbi:MAG: hypothetical protein IKE91_06915 [Clostridia bacterium]|nr:hypothetical protein [Clostridia bacterium]
MKKFFKVIIILIVAAILAIDFYGLWKYKLSGKQYVLETGEDDSADTYVEDDTEELTSESMEEDEVFFIKNIEKTDEGYKITGSTYVPYEIEKDDYTSLRNGQSVEILGEAYKKYQIRSNNLVIKSAETGNINYYINYNITSKKYILKDNQTDDIVYKATEKNYKLVVSEGTTFVTVKNGNNSNKKIEDVVDSHQDKTAPEEETSEISTCTITFNSNGTCTKITETVR